MSSKGKQKGGKESLKDKLDNNELDLSLSNLTKVPVREIAALPKATRLDLSCNLLVSLPDNFCSLTQIVHLDLSKNALTSLPENFGDLLNLKHLDLLNNQIQRLPISFADLDGLKWLDLKDNPLDEPPTKVIGDCLDDKQCKFCAQRVLNYMKNVQKEFRARSEAELQKQQAREAAEEAERLAEEEKQRNLKKKQKQMEKERRRQEYLAAQQMKSREAEQVEEDEEEEDDDDDDQTNLKSDKPTANGLHSKHQEDKKGSSCLLIFITILFALLAMAVGTYFYCESNQSFQFCESVHQSVHPLVQQLHRKYQSMLQ